MTHKNASPAKITLVFFPAATARKRSPARRASSAACQPDFHLPFGATSFFAPLRCFGNLWETGRTVNPVLAHQFGYGTFHWSWTALYGLFFSPAKGLFIINPITVACWPCLHSATGFRRQSNARPSCAACFIPGKRRLALYSPMYSTSPPNSQRDWRRG